MPQGAKLVQHTVPKNQNKPPLGFLWIHFIQIHMLDDFLTPFAQKGYDVSTRSHSERSGWVFRGAGVLLRSFSRMTVWYWLRNIFSKGHRYSKHANSLYLLLWAILTFYLVFLILNMSCSQFLALLISISFKQDLPGSFEPRHEKPCLRGLRPGN